MPDVGPPPRGLVPVRLDDGRWREMSTTTPTWRAMLAELVRYRAFLQNLVLKDLKLKYRDSTLGVAWSLLHPLLLIVVYTVAFKYVMRVDMEAYAYFLLIGLLPWSFFASSLMASTGAIVANGGLIRKAYFPREILPIATVIFCFVQLLLALVVFLPALVLISGVELRWTAALFPPLLLLHMGFTVGIGFILSALTTAFRDVAHLTEVALVLLFWMTPIVYPARMAPPELRLFFSASPLAAFATAYQDLLFWGRLPAGHVAATLLAWTVALLIVGRWVFASYSPSFAEEV